MVFVKETLKVNTESAIQLLNITERVKALVKQSHIREGLVVVFSPHTTAYINLNEYEEKLEQDIVEFFREFLPSNKVYLHDLNPIDQRQNARAHVMGLFMNGSETIPITQGALVLGDWQSLFFIELDGPRASRHVIVQLMGEV